MCEKSPNLIDLSVEEDILNVKVNETATDICSRQAAAAELPLCPMPPPLIGTTGRDSLDNNPFDRAQKLASLPEDPFDLVEKEVCDKARNARLPQVEVKLANLLSLSDDNILDEADEDSPGVKDVASDTCHFTSTVCLTASSHNLDGESPPLSIKWTPESAGSLPESLYGSGGSSTDGSGGGNVSNKFKRKAHQPLFKRVLTNSTFNTPTSCRTMNKLTPLSSSGNSDDEHLGSPISKREFNRTPSYEEPMLECESPLKFIGDDDDLLAEEPPALIDAEKDFEADLAMLSLPMLKQLPSTKEEEVLVDVEDPKSEQSTLETPKLPDLATLKAKLKAKREENNNNDITALIKNLKSLICDNETVDAQKKQEAHKLLETLSKAITTSNEKPVSFKSLTDGGMEDSTSPPPKTITRQGTFDIDLQDKESTDHNHPTSPASTVAGEISHLTSQSSTQSLHSLHSNAQEVPMSDVPDCMLKSSATYDGETADEKRDFVLPEVEPFSPHHIRSASQTPPQPSSSAAMTLQPDVNALVEQLTRLLEQNHLNQQQQHHGQLEDTSENSETCGGGVTNAGALNPTFIVVMNTPQIPNSAAMVAALQNSFCDQGNMEECDDHMSISMTRRRSQSLSIHDKVKIVQLPLVTTQHASQNYAGQEASPPTNSPPGGCEHEFKTPARFMRRNSFSSGTRTPHTPRTSLAYGMSASNIKRPHSRAQLETHTEGEANNEMSSKPKTVQTNFKPELKRKTKSKTTESILKSTAPLKATMPVKSVLPSIRTSPPPPSTEDIASNSNAAGISLLNKTNLNTSIQLLTRSGKMSYTSTPMPGPRMASNTGLPNSCSTPALPRASPLRRSSVSGTGGTSSSASVRPRLAYLPTTPNSRTNSLSSGVGTSQLRRRTITEFKAKSPIKSRLSGLGVKPPTSGGLAGGGRMSYGAAKSVDKAKTAAATVRPTSRLSMRNTSLSSKENKKP